VRPSQRPIDELVRRAADLYYVVRRLSSLEHTLPRAQILDCSSCGEKVVATPYVLAERRAIAASHGRTLTIICDECVPGNAARNGRTVVALMPTLEEAEAAQRFNRG
jgi:hypothetical protein